MKSLALVVAVTLAGAGLALAAADGGQRLDGGWPVMVLLVLVAYLLNWAVYLPSFLRRTERFFDLTGSLTFCLLTVLALVLAQDRDARAWVLGAMVLLWALRLGSFLFRRILASGSDGRFDELKQSWSRFLLVWSTQALWVVFTAGAALTAITSQERLPLGWFAGVGIGLWVLGFALEATADAQKAAFRADPANQGRFISTGVWSWSRHPNYVGEILLWLGVALVALPVLSGWQYLTLLSPVLIYLQLRFASGVPPLERRADARWGGQQDYEAYKRSTPVLLPVPGGRSR
jgi:steroid 5-alpha reductase family enzyme